MMTQNLAKYHVRAPRYILQAQDNTLVRVAGPKQIPWEEGTEIRNVSLSGLSFTAPSDLCPSMGESVKIEFEIPGGQRMASFATVTRIETYGRTQMLVGIKFENLNKGQRIILAQGLALKLREQQILRLKRHRDRLGFLAPYRSLFFLFIWIALFYAQTRWDLIHLFENYIRNLW